MTSTARRARSTWARFAILTFGCVLLARPLAAQCAPVAGASGSSVSARLCMQVKDVMVLAATGGLSAPSTLTASQFTSSGAPAASSTYVPYGGSLTFAVSSNREFALTVQGTFGATAKSPADVLWSTTSGNFTNTALNVSASNSAANRTIPFPSRVANGSVSQTVYLASRWIFEADKPGVYPLTLVFTLAPK